jgi:hydrogenase expression/formation protein HypE
MDERITLSHGGGGRATHRLVSELFLPAFDNPLLAQGNDQAILGIPAGRIAMTTDSFVVRPLVFPGGDIGSLAVYGTVNDLAMGGAQPLCLAAALIMEEGLPMDILRQIVASMADAARRCGVPIATGDTKVVERGKGDGLFITTSGLGMVAEGVELGAGNCRPGDAIILSGSIGDHGMAIMAQREHLGFETTLCSDSAPLHELVAVMLAAAPNLRCLRDPTRGGLAATLNELAHASGVGMRIEEQAIPVHDAVRGACELLGLDPVHVANEGKLVAICPPQETAALLAAMHAHPLGREAACIGTVVADSACWVSMTTTLGGERLVDWLSGEQLPRIC